MAYFADDRQDLLNGINEFLDCSIVIPPSDVEGKDLLKTVADFQKQMLRKRKERELKRHQSICGVEPNNKGTLSSPRNETPFHAKSSIPQFEGGTCDPAGDVRPPLQTEIYHKKSDFSKLCAEHSLNLYC